MINKKQFWNDPKFIEMQKWYKEMLELGIAEKPRYNLPPLDTIGRRVKFKNPFAQR